MNTQPSRPDSSNPFTEPALAHRYEQWYATAGRCADMLEKELLGILLDSFPNARSVVEVGCGTGHFTRWMAGRGLTATGVDISRPMLDEALRLGGPQYFAGDALSLPLIDRSVSVQLLSDRPDRHPRVVRVLHRPPPVR